MLLRSSANVLESGWLRCRKLRGKGQGASTELAESAVRVYGNDVCGQVEQWARYALNGFSAGDSLRAHLGTVRRLLKPPMVDTIALRRQIAAQVIERESYPW